jgi:hypothetical protein
MPKKSDEESRLAYERRKQSALERLGTNNPRCICCNEDSWECLELHHMGGKKNSEFTVIICRNCHRKLSNLQKAHPKQDYPPKDLLEAVGFFLLGLADFLVLLIEKLREFGQALIDRARAAPTAEGALS